ncbi:MAG: flagellar hook-associated protein FlgK [Deltaproteobacteria bacterium RIFOXYD12_FULL_50_9]|nr:MAG: flagellar hook-associated protein FlgK [Deltaproteobacteria bacterium RIFOXYD12_FULL_50_9]
MPGISNVLNMAKEALMAHQLAVQVTSHNVSNANTAGFTRQALELSTNIATPTAFGNIGGGVIGSGIMRKYDAFMTQRLMGQNSTMGNLESQQQSLRVVESIFNEAPGLQLNDLMSQFWNSWQNLANSPDTQSFRQEIVQQAQLFNQQMQNMTTEIAKTKYDLNINLDSAIKDVNGLTKQIASINYQISSSETTQQKANDLRDSRDELIKDLSGYLDISYFENKIGEYTVILPDGHSLVDSTQSWKIDWADNTLQWVNQTTNGSAMNVPIGQNFDLGGKIGGMLSVFNQLSEGDPDNYLGRLNGLANAFIREVNQQHSQGVGLTCFSEAITGTEIANNAARLTTTVNAVSAIETITANSMQINGRDIGEIRGAAAVNGLAMGKAANAVSAINNGIAGVTARLTTLVAGSAVTPMPLLPPLANDGDTVSFSINGIAVNYTIDNDGVGLDDDSDPALYADHLVNAINSAINTYNADPTTPVFMSLQATVGDDTNGGALNSIVLSNTNAGDESQIIVGDLASLPPGLENSLGLTAGTYIADKTHNTGQTTIFSDEDFTIEAGNNDSLLSQLGMAGGLHPDDTPNDGKLTYAFNNPGGVANALMGFKYADQLVTDNAGFDIWLYKSDGTLALPQPINVSLERAFTLNDVAKAINVSITNATGGAAHITASVNENELTMSPAVGYKFAFANDTSNFLQVNGLNTFFSGYSASTISVNQGLVNDLTKVTAGMVTENGQIWQGDNSNALKITNIQRDENIKFSNGTVNTLDDYYNSLVGEIGITGKNVDRELEFNTLVTNQMTQLRDSVSGVSLDEEMANLIKFQQAFTAAARLITTADEMMSTLVDSLRR